MTWEQKLLDILGVNEEFDQDSDIGSFIDDSPIKAANQIEVSIKTGNSIAVKEAAEKFETAIQKWKELLNHLRKNPSCVKWDKHRNNYCWENGCFVLGYNKYPNGLQEVADKMLHFSRLIRDAEKRAAKHPKFRQV